MASAGAEPRAAVPPEIGSLRTGRTVTMIDPPRRFRGSARTTRLGHEYVNGQGSPLFDVPQRSRSRVGRTPSPESPSPPRRRASRPEAAGAEAGDATVSADAEGDPTRDARSRRCGIASARDRGGPNLGPRRANRTGEQQVRHHGTRRPRRVLSRSASPHGRPSPGPPCPRSSPPRRATRTTGRCTTTTSAGRGTTRPSRSSGRRTSGGSRSSGGSRRRAPIARSASSTPRRASSTATSTSGPPPTRPSTSSPPTAPSAGRTGARRSTRPPCRPTTGRTTRRTGPADSSRRPTGS